MLNTVTDIAGQEIAQVAAWLEDDDRAVDIRGVVIARLGSGALVTMNGCGRAIPGYGSPEVGRKMARLWDAIRESSARGGAVVRLGEAG